MTTEPQTNQATGQQKGLLAKIGDWFPVSLSEGSCRGG
jgi:hypothetical protein